jgi:hypothetical protein
MVDQQGQRQTNTGSTAPSTEARDTRSDDAIYSVNETKRLQQEAQARIDKTRHDTVGVAP